MLPAGSGGYDDGFAIPGALSEYDDVLYSWPDYFSWPEYSIRQDVHEQDLNRQELDDYVFGPDGDDSPGGGSSSYSD